MVTVDDLTKAASQVRGLASKYGGYVSTESTGISSGTSVDDYSATSVSSSQYQSSNSSFYASPGEARIVLRVKPEQTQAAMDGVAAQGKEVSRWRTDTDVELQLVDLESRIQTQTTSLQDLRKLLGQAKSLSDIITLENEINSRTADLESLKAQQRALSDDVAYSTLTAVLRTPARTDEAVSDEGFLGGLRAGWLALLGSLNAILTIAGALLPFAVVFALLAWPIRRWLMPRLRTRRQARAASRSVAPSAQAMPPAAPAPVGPAVQPAGHYTGSE